MGIDEGIDGLIHISDLSWTKKFKHPSELYKKGQKIRAVVLNIDEKNERFSLGVKQLEKDPWEGISQKYSPGDIVEGKVTNITDFGIFLELSEGIEGLIHVSEINRDKGEKLSEFVKPGDLLKALIISIDEKERKIGLSLKGLETKTEKEEIAEYIDKQKSLETPLGEILEKKEKVISNSEENKSSETTASENIVDQPAEEEPSGEKSPSQSKITSSESESKTSEEQTEAPSIQKDEKSG